METLKYTAGAQLRAGDLVCFGADGKLYPLRVTEAERQRGFTILSSLATGKTVRMPIDPLAMRNLLDAVMTL